MALRLPHPAKHVTTPAHNLLQLYLLFPSYHAQVMATLVKILLRTGAADVHTTFKKMDLPVPHVTGLVSPEPIAFITSNARKLEEVRTIVGPDFPIPIQPLPITLDEIQDADGDRIAARKCCEAVTRLGSQRRLVIDDASLAFHALNGMPGPYVKWFEKKIGVEGLPRLLTGFEDKSAFAIATFTFWDGKQIIMFKGQTEGKVVPPRGPKLFSWSPIFMPSGSQQTFAEMDAKTKYHFSHRTKAVSLFKEYVTNVLKSH